MVLLPAKNPKHQLVLIHDAKHLMTTLDPIPRPAQSLPQPQPQLPPSSKKLARRKPAAEAEAEAAMSCGTLTVSWTRFIWSTASWTLLVCLLLARGRKGHSDENGATDNAHCSISPPLLHEDHAFLSSLVLDGNLSFSNTSSAALDFGLITFSTPAAIVYPSSVRDVAAVVSAVASSTSSGLTVAAKGRGHSVRGQAQALNGIVIEMSTLKGINVLPHGVPGRRQPFVDVAGGELWFDVLEATMKHGLAPRSWTDYLYLSIGGTLSNAGIGGQTFLYGPEISNVLQLDVVTGTGDLVKCSPSEQPDLFYGVLGGLGQFGIITKARIVLEPAHEKVRWIRAMYSDFATFARDQEMLISQPPESAFDYIEGFVVVKNEDCNNGWNSVPFNGDQIDASMIPEQGGPVLYYIEVVKKFNLKDLSSLNQTVEGMLAPLSFIPTLVFTTDVPYAKFLNRLHDVELNLASQGLWDVPHPWLNLFVPGSSITRFDALIFKHMIKDDFSGPILIYALKRERWDTRSSVVIPDESIFYIVAFLRNSLPSSGPSLGSLIADNDEILNVCQRAGLGCKRYLPEYKDRESWMTHFGSQWETFVRRKHEFDPRAILAPGQNIFARKQPQPQPQDMAMAAAT